MFSFKHTTFASMIKILILYFLSILSLHAQDHLNSWSRITFLKNFSKSFNTSIEFQHRRQNNFASDNPFDKNLMNSFRIWNTISLSKKTNISISPFAVFRNFTIIESIDALAVTYDSLPINIKSKIMSSTEVHKIENPPYATSANMGKSSKAGVSDTLVKKMMLSEGLGNACDQLFNQFLYQNYKLSESTGKKVHIG
jgi:hypothetical protein